MDRFLDWFAHFVTHRRGLALGIIGVLTVATAVWIPTLVADPMPTRLTASSVQDQARVAREFNARFGNPDRVVVLLVSAPDVLAQDPLAYVHRLSIAMSRKPFVDRVESITLTPVALRAPASEESLDTLDSLEAEPEVTPEVEQALGVLVRSARERFPMGLGTIAERMGDVRFGPAVEGDGVEPSERAALEEALRDAPLLEGRLISRDRTVTAIAIFLDESAQSAEGMEHAVTDIDASLAANAPPRGVSLAIGGIPHLLHAIIVKMQNDNFRIIPMTLAACVILLWLSFRWVPGIVLPLAAVCISAVMVVGTMALFGEPMNVINNIIPPLLIIIGLSEAIHVVQRYREELEHSPNKAEAARRAVKAMTVACFLTSFTSAVGMGSLFVSQTQMLSRFGVIAGLGLMIAYVVTVVFVPAAMTSFRPPLPPRGVEGPTLHRADRGWLERSLVVLTRSAIRRPWRWLLGAAVVTAVWAWGALQVRVDSTLLDEFEEGDPIYQSARLMEDELDGMRPLEVMLTAGPGTSLEDPRVLAEISDTQTWLRAQPGVLSTLAPTDHLHETWSRISGDPEARSEPFRSREQVAALVTLVRQADRDPLASFLTADRRVARLQVRLADVGARASTVLIRRLQDRLQSRLRPLGVEVAMTGEAYTGSLGLEAVVGDLLGSLGTATIPIFGVILLLFGSLRLGILSMPPNIVPLVGTVAWMTVRDIPMSAATVIIFSISLGLAVDGSIHILARFREEQARGAGRNVAIIRAARTTGRAIIISGATLMLGFGVMLFSSFVPVRRFGELIAITVTTGLVSTLILMPALLRLGAPKKATRPPRIRLG